MLFYAVAPLVPLYEQPKVCALIFKRKIASVEGQQNQRDVDECAYDALELIQGQIVLREPLFVLYLELSLLEAKYR
jgi:hypothetical protein